MIITDMIASRISTLSSNEKKIAEYIIQNPESIANYTMTKIAELTSTSTSAVLRFCQKIGFKGYSEFHYEMIRELNSGSVKEAQPNEKDRMQGIINQFISSLHNLASSDMSDMQELCKNIKEASMVYCIGIHKSSTIAKKMAVNLIDCGIRAAVISDMVSLNHLDFIKQPSDVFIYFSISGQSNEAKTFFETNYNSINSTWLITCSRKPLLQKYFKHTITIPVLSKYGSEQVDYHAVIMVYVELLTDYLSHLL